MHFSKKKVCSNTEALLKLVIGSMCVWMLHSCRPLEPSGVPKGPTVKELPKTLESARLSFEFANEDTLNLLEGIAEMKIGLRIYGLNTTKSSESPGLDVLLDRFPSSREVALTEEFKELFSLEFDQNYEELPKQGALQLDFKLANFGKKLVEITLFDGEVELARGKTTLIVYPGENDVNGQIKLFKLSAEKSPFDLVLTIISQEVPQVRAANLKPVQAFVEEYCIACHAGNYGALVDANPEQFINDPENQMLLKAAVFRVLQPEDQGIMPPASFGSQPSEAERQAFNAQVASLPFGEDPAAADQVSLDAGAFFALKPNVVLNIKGEGVSGVEASGVQKENALVFQGLNVAPGQYELSLSISFADKTIEKPLGSVEFKVSPVKINRALVFDEAEVRINLELEVVPAGDVQE